MSGGGGHPSPEVLADALSPSWRDRFARSSVARPRGTAARAASLLALLAVGLAAAQALQPAPEPSPARPRVLGVTVDVPPPGLRGDPAPEVVATYRISTPAGASLRLRGVTGPLVASSVVGPRMEGGTALRVGAFPSCRRLPAAGRGRYTVGVERVAAGGGTTRGVLRSPSAVADWDAALRQVCWQQRATDGIDVVSLRARPEHRQLALAVTLRSRLPDDVAVGAVDVADVATLEASDSRVLRHGARAVLRVRWPVADCAAPTLPQHTFVATPSTAGRTLPALDWSVGRPGRDPGALFVTPLAPAQVSALRAALGRLCTPSGTSVTVRAARQLPPSPVVRDPTGVALAVQLSVATTTRRVVVGTVPTGLTADARVGISAAAVRPAGGHAVAVVVWHARCSSTDPAPPVLPVALADDGRLVRYAVTLDQPVLARVYAQACDLDPARLRRSGWR